MLLDRAQLLDDIGGDDELVQQVLDCAAGELPKEIEKLVACCAGSDTEAIRIQAHGVKSISADIYAQELQERCGLVETAGKEGDLERARALLPELERVARETIAALR